MQVIKLESIAKEVKVEKLPLGRYAELLKQLRKIPKRLQGLPNLENQTIIDNLPELIADSLPDFIGLISIATDLKPEEIEKLGLDEVVEITIAIIEVNKYAEVYSMIKKATARPQVESQIPEKT